MYFCALASLSLLLQCCGGSKVSPKYEQTLIKTLFTDYEVESRPTLNLSDPVVVHFGIAYSEIVDLDEKRQALTSNVWIRQRWKDAWLSWNSSEYGGLNSIHVSPSFVWKPDIVLFNNELFDRIQRWRDPWLSWNASQYGDLSSINVSPEKVWRPDIVLYNNVNGDDHGEQYLFKTKVIVTSDGMVTWYSPNIIKTSCKIDVEYFPFDTQTCKITFGSWTYNGFKLDLEFFGGKATADLAKFTKSGEWELISAEGKKNVLYYSCCPEPYPDLTFHVQIKRRTLFYVNNLIVPCIVLALLTGTAFVFPPESGERVSLVMTILLGMTVFMIIFNESIPSTSEVTPLIGKYFTAILLEIALCLMATCVTLNMHHKNPRMGIPHWARLVVIDMMGKVLCPFAMKQLEKQNTQRHPEATSSSIPDAITSRVNPVELTEQNGNCGNGSIVSRTELLNTGLVKVAGMEKVCRYIDCLSDDEVRQSEWHLLVKVIDRLFMVLFLLTFVISSLAMLANR